jgi:hypothetical protein
MHPMFDSEGGGVVQDQEDAHIFARNVHPCIYSVAVDAPHKRAFIFDVNFLSSSLQSPHPRLCLKMQNPVFNCAFDYDTGRCGKYLQQACIQ